MFAQKKSANYSEQVTASRPDLIFKVTGRDADTGKHAWYYVTVDRNKRDTFRKRNGVASLQLSDYGKILYSGFGAEPPAVIKEIMTEKFHYSE